MGSTDDRTDGSGRSSADARTGDATAACVEDFEIPANQNPEDKVERNGPSDQTACSDSIDIKLEAGKYKCKFQSHIGKLSISTEGIKFITAVRSHEQWSLGYGELKSIKKVGTRRKQPMFLFKECLVYLHGIPYVLVYYPS